MKFEEMITLDLNKVGFKFTEQLMPLFNNTMTSSQIHHCHIRKINNNLVKNHTKSIDNNIFI